MVLKLSFTPTPKIELHPVTSIGTPSQPHFMDAEEAESFLLRLADRSDEMISEQIVKGEVILLPTVASSARMAMIKQ